MHRPRRCRRRCIVFIRDWLSSNNVLLKGRAMRNGPSQTGATAAPSETTA